MPGRTDPKSPKGLFQKAARAAANDPTKLNKDVLDRAFAQYQISYAISLFGADALAAASGVLPAIAVANEQAMMKHVDDQAVMDLIVEQDTAENALPAPANEQNTDAGVRPATFSGRVVRGRR